MNEEKEFPLLENLTDGDLVSLLAEYVNKQVKIDDTDRRFIAAIKAELKQRSGKKRLEL